MADEIVRAMTADGYVKAVAVTGRDLVERARNIHTLLPMAGYTLVYCPPLFWLARRIARRYAVEE